MHINFKHFKKIITCISAGIISMSAFTLSASADEPYDVYNYDRWGEAAPSQAGYIAERAVTGEELGTGHFNAPSDIFLANDGKFYIADTGNNRIVVIDSDFEKTLAVYDSFDYNGEKLTLKSPGGIYVNKDDSMLYIADTENSRIIKCDTDGKVKLIIEKPDSELYGRDITFLPKKILVDNFGYVYTVVDNSTRGAVMFDSDGDFLGFYGANTVEATSKVVYDYLWKLFATEEMLEGRTKSVPPPFTNFDFDSSGFIFTCMASNTQTADRVKKLNPAGNNLFAGYSGFGDFETEASGYGNTKSAIVDIDIAPDGSINCLDYTYGRIFQYDKEAELLFICGTKADQLGGFREAAAIESTNDKLYVVDSAKNSVTIFEETVFGSYVHEATNLYNAGYFEEALEPWYEVIRRDGNYRRAYEGISSAMLNRGDYKEAMRYAKLAMSQWRYDRAFEGWRSEFINDNFQTISLLLVLLIALLTTLRILRKKGLIFKKRKERGARS